MRLHLWFYDMLFDAIKNLCKGVERGNLTTEEALKTYTNIMLKTLEAGTTKESGATGELTIKVKVDTEEFDRAMGRVIKQARKNIPDKPKALESCELCSGVLLDVTEHKDLPDKRYMCFRCGRTFVVTPEIEELEKTMQKIYEKISRQMKGDRGRNKL